MARSVQEVYEVDADDGFGFWRVSFYEADGSVVHDGLVFGGDGRWKQEMVASWLRGEEPDFAGW